MAEAVAPPGQPGGGRGPFACRLALKLVDEALGPVCRKVVSCLIDHGTQQYGDLLRFSGLPAAQLRSALLVLIQHNHVNCYRKEEPPTLRGPGPSYSLYEAALPRILQSLRVPRFLTHIADERGQESVRLIHNILEHGRLRWDQLLEAVCSEAAEEDSEDALPDTEVLLNQFRSLVIERFIERVPPCNLPPPPFQVHPNARKKKAAPKPGTEEEADLHREQQEAQQRQEYQEVRFQLPEELAGARLGEAAGLGVAAEQPAGKRRRGKVDAAEEPAKKRGRKKAGGAGIGGAEGDSLGAAACAKSPGSGGAAGGGEQAPVLWRVNYDEFNRRFRNDVIARTVKTKYGSPASQAVSGLLLANARFEQSAHTGETVVLSVADASGALRRMHGNEGVPDNIAAVLSELAEDEYCFLDSRGIGPGGEQFVMNIPKVLKLACLQELHAVIRNKFGQHGMRVWRLLLMHGQLEQKQVADMAMITKEIAREKLYAMLKAGYLALQDVPRTADHAPSRTFYTWRANFDAAVARMASDMYRAAGNLHARLGHELEKQKDLLDLLEMPSVAAHVLERRQEEIVALRAVTTRLEASLLDLDVQIHCFSDC